MAFLKLGRTLLIFTKRLVTPCKGAAGDQKHQSHQVVQLWGQSYPVMEQQATNKSKVTMCTQTSHDHNRTIAKTIDLEKIYQI